MKSTKSSGGLLQGPDGVLDELVGGEKDGVHGARASHGDS